MFITIPTLFEYVGIFTTQVDCIFRIFTLKNHVCIKIN